MLEEIQKTLTWQPKLPATIANETRASFHEVTAVLRQLVAAGLCRPTASGYVRAK